MQYDLNSFVSILTIIISIITLLPSKKKSLSYSAKSHKSQISNLFYYDINIINNGKSPIHPNDFIGNLSIKPIHGSKVYNAITIYKKPKNINVNLLINKNEEANVIILPTLLNSRDNFTIRLYLDIPNENFDIIGRIYDIKYIKHKKIHFKNLKMTHLISLLIVILIFAISILNLVSWNTSLRIALIILLVSALSNILKSNNRNELSILTRVAAIILILFWLLPYSHQIFNIIENLF